MSVKYTTPAQHKSNLRNVYGTFAIEGMTISKDTRNNLDRIGSGQASYQQVVNELRAKYAKKGRLCSQSMMSTPQSMYCYACMSLVLKINCSSTLLLYKYKCTKITTVQAILFKKSTRTWVETVPVKRNCLNEFNST